MEKNKYYTPDIKEFRIGFECEFFNHMQDKVWKKETCDMDLISLAYDCYEHGTIEWKDDITQTFRVKLLDKEDIESFGFEFQEEMLNIKYFYFYSNNDVYQLTHSEDYTKIVIKGINSEKNLCIFRGKIKNKSELEVVLKQIGVI